RGAGRQPHRPLVPRGVPALGSAGRRRRRLGTVEPMNRAKSALFLALALAVAVAPGSSRRADAVKPGTVKHLLIDDLEIASRENNILRWGENWMRRANVIKDTRDPDPERNYKMTYVDVIGGRTAITKAYSRDGIHWRLNGDGKPWFRENHNSNLLGWDPRIG